MISKLKCMKCKNQNHVTDIFNMLSLSLPSNDPMKVTGYVVPYLFSDTIRSYDFQTTERLKYSDFLKSIGNGSPHLTKENYIMYFLLSSRVVGRNIKPKIICGLIIRYPK
jgi:hypothetical protein